MKRGSVRRFQAFPLAGADALNRFQNRTVAQADVPQITFPDGGLKAWTNVAGCTLISLTAFGKHHYFPFRFEPYH